MGPRDKQMLVEQRAVTAHNREVRDARVRRMIDEGLTVAVIAQRVGLRKGLGRLELKRMVGYGK